MKKYNITIEEMISETFEVYAEDDEQAEIIAKEKYDKGEFTLTPGNLVCKQMEIENVTDKYLTDWFEF